MQVAKEILNQLGGNKFIAMTGAKNLVGGENCLQFSIGRGAKRGINKVRVELTSMDDYAVTFWKITGVDFKKVDEANGVFCDNLASIFTEKTGFETRL